MGVEQNENQQPAHVVNLSKSVFLHADLMQIIVTIPSQIAFAVIKRYQNVIIRLA